MSNRYLLDTCMLIYLSRDEPISASADAAIDATEFGRGGLSISPISAWELGLLVAKRRLNTTRDPHRWFYDFVEGAGLDVPEATPAILIAASFLPQPIHSDPADRIIIATAREHDLTIITRDRAILAYGDAGHVKTLAC